MLHIVSMENHPCKTKETLHIYETADHIALDMDGKRYAAYSPFRISFGGGGTDISPFCDKYGGAVVNTAIDRGVTVVYTPDEYDLEISSRDFLKSVLIGKGNGHNDVLNKMSKLLESRGISKGRIVINSGVPPGSGLGSSSALTTALLKLVYLIQGKAVDPWSLAREAFSIEHDYFGVTLGKQDPFAVSLGNFKYMEFGPDGQKSVDLSQYPDFMDELEKRTLLVYTGNTRESTSVLQEQVEKSRLGDTGIVANLLAMKGLATEMKDSVVSGNFEGFSSAVNAGWKVKKQLGKKVSNERIDSLISVAMGNGAEAAKLMGGGADGFLLVISRHGSVQQLQKILMDSSNFVVRVSFDRNGTRVYRPDEPAYASP